MTSLDVIRVWKASQVAFECSIRYSWAFLFNPVGLSPLTVNSMYLAFLWFCWLSLSFWVPLGSSGHPLSTALLTFVFWLLKKFLISSSLPRTQFSAVILCLYLSRSSETLSMKAVLIWSQVAASFIESAYHSAAGPRTSEENSAFFLNRYRALSAMSVGLDPSEKLILFSTVSRNDFPSWSGSLPENLSKAKSGIDTVFSVIVSSVYFRGCLSLGGFFHQFKLK